MTPNLPSLDGTPKQAAYAARVRAKALADHAARLAGARTRGADPAKVAEVQAKVARMAAITSSRWWIDNGSSQVAADRLQRIDWVWTDTGHGYEWRPA